MAAPPPSKLVKAICGRLGLSQTELGRALYGRGLNNANYQRVHNWTKDLSPIRYEELWELLDLAGWLRVDEDALPGATTVDPLKELGANDAEILGNQRATLELLREIRETLALPDEAAPARPTRKGR